MASRVAGMRSYKSEFDDLCAHGRYSCVDGRNARHAAAGVEPSFSARSPVRQGGDGVIAAPASAPDRGRTELRSGAAGRVRTARAIKDREEQRDADKGLNCASESSRDRRPF
jgi:hypothetical protein